MPVSGAYQRPICQSGGAGQLHADLGRGAGAEGVNGDRRRRAGQRQGVGRIAIVVQNPTGGRAGVAVAENQITDYLGRVEMDRYVRRRIECAEVGRASRAVGDAVDQLLPMLQRPPLVLLHVPLVLAARAGSGCNSKPTPTARQSSRTA